MKWQLNLAFILILSISASAQPLNNDNRPSLENRQWNIVTYFDGTKLVVPLRRMFGGEGRIEEVPWPDITFSNGAITGSPGCAGFLGGYMLSGNALKITASWILAGFCPPDGIAQNYAVGDALNAVHSWKWEGDQVELLDGDGRVRVALSPSSPSP